jgi:hypothetical protein
MPERARVALWTRTSAVFAVSGSFHEREMMPGKPNLVELFKLNGPATRSRRAAAIKRYNEAVGEINADLHRAGVGPALIQGLRVASEELITSLEESAEADIVMQGEPSELRPRHHLLFVGIIIGALVGVAGVAAGGAFDLYRQGARAACVATEGPAR